MEFIDKQSYFNNGETLINESKFKDALDYFQKSNSLVLTKEELWFRNYKIFQCHIALKNTDIAKMIFQQTNLGADRAEPAYCMCKELREQGKPFEAFYYYTLAKSKKEPGDGLNIEKRVYQYLIDFEASVLWYYISKDKHYGLHLSKQVLQNENTTLEIYNCVHNNQLFYVKSIGGSLIEEQPVEYEPNWFYTTPTFIENDILYRIVNYQMDSSGYYHIKDPNNIVRTRNLWVNKGLLQVEDNLNLKCSTEKHVQGLEDLRLTKRDSDIFALAATWDYCQLTNGVVQVLLSIDESTLTTKVLTVFSQTVSQCEKNWVWIEFPYIVYNWYPNITILKIDEQNRYAISTYKKVVSSPLLRNARGSSNAFLHNNKYWFLIHTVIDRKSSIRHYLHQWVVLTKTYEIESISVPFTFEENADVEFCTALKLNKDGAVVGYSIRDGTPKLKQIPWENIYKLF